MRRNQNANDSLAQSIRSPVEVEPCKASGGTVSAVLEAVFANHARLCSYLLDDRGAVRKHVSVIVNGEAVKDREALSEAGAKDAEIFVMRALSGG